MPGLPCLGREQAQLNLLSRIVMLAPTLYSSWPRLLRGLTPVLFLALQSLCSSTAQAQAPVLTRLLPTRNALAVPRSTALVLDFDQALPAELPAGALRVFSAQQGGQRSGTLSTNGSTLTFTPTTPFRAGEQIWATLTTALQSSGGTSLAKPQVWQFTTATVPALGAFSGTQDYAVGAGPQDIAVGDITGDGHIDLLTANYGAASGSTVSVYLGDGKGAFAPGAAIPVGTAPTNVLLGDVDGDEDLDVVTGNRYNSPVSTASIRLNNGDGTFQVGQQVPLGVDLERIVLGDIDGDGDLDLLASNSGSLSVSIRLNDGQGRFSGTQELEDPDRSRVADLSLGDLDSDGDLDLVVANTYDNTVSIYQNDGQGLFSKSQKIVREGNPVNVTLADLDGDGDLDLLTGAADNMVVITFNDGHGTFSGGRALEDGAFDMAVGDLDGDGDLDLLTTDRSFSVRVRLNDGQGTFTSSGQVAVSAIPVGLVLGDADADNDLDLFTVNSSNRTASVRLNQLQPPPVITSVSPASGAVGESVVISGTYFLGATKVTFNGVENPAFQVLAPAGNEILVKVPPGATTGPVVVTTPTGSSNSFLFTVTPSLVVTSLQPARNALAVPRTLPLAVSFDQPLRSDSATLSALRVFSAQAGGRLAGTTTVSGNTLRFTPAAAFKPGETILATVTREVRSSGGTPLAVPQVLRFTTATAPSAGSFGGGPEVPVGFRPRSVAVGDVDGDGDLDLLTANAQAADGTSTVSLRLNDGTGGFKDGKEAVTFTRTVLNEVFLQDLDGNGSLDLVVSYNDRFSRGGVDILRNDGTGSFRSILPRIFLGSGDRISIAFGDVEGDGDLDLLTQGFSSMDGQAIFRARAYLNDGNGVFSGITDVLSSAYGTAAGDLDADGDVDFVVAFNSARVYLNNGRGVFNPTQEAAASFDPRSLALGDVDADGDLDLLLANPGSRQAILLLNDGTGTFGSAQEILVGLNPEKVVLGDVDGDGDLDLLTPNSSSNSVSVRLNNGRGVFSGSQEVAVGLMPRGLVLGDMNNDGNLDLVTVNMGSNTVSVRLNQNSSPGTYRLNSGGPQLSTSLGLFAADTAYSPSPGNTYATTVPIEGTNDDALYQTERYSNTGQLRYALPVENGTYQVVLHFAEIYWSAPKQRLFDVSLQGQKVLDNYDIFGKVGTNTATTESFTATVTDGILALDMSSLPQDGGVDYPKLSALEVLRLQQEYRLNSGGPQLSTSLGLFAADTAYSPSPGNTYSTTMAIAGTQDDALYQTERYGSAGQLSYALPLSNGSYQVVLHFAEIYWHNTGERLFDVSLEGQKVLDNYDIFSKVGANVATTESFAVKVTDGVLNLELSSLAADGGLDQPKLSALEVLPLGGTSVAQVRRPAPFAPPALPQPELGVYPNPSAGTFTLNYQSSQAQNAQLMLTDALGRVVMQQALELQAGLNQVRVKVPDTAPGLYHLTVRPTDRKLQRYKVQLQP
ncbi:FG-GAP-like repeat-containing protein [Hymenobacter fodinae]|uniref:T9SS type A sorting domain-containing protein n=1 Tax=Hymenobacter fodinae TaxID=2510796 RepID=A0A4Z0P4K5_9BACT|nr:FG-GAP-like repeat-containing protein [Hymenobacter fodinae]TGE05326.1 T9SS type A sorting domain-containing protein [Hymenobacter fodinae]